MLAAALPSTAGNAACWVSICSMHTDHETIAEHTRAQMRARDTPKVAEDGTAASALLMRRIKR